MLIGSVQNQGYLQGQISNSHGFLTGVISNAGQLGGQVIAKRGLKGDTGDTGNGIASVEKTGTSGLIDEYTITYTDGTTTVFYVSNGADGQDGADGHSPVITAQKVGNTATLFVDGVAVATISDGQDGQDGEDGFSPIANVSKVGDTATITITDKNGTTTVRISDGQDGEDGQDGHSPVITASKVDGTTTVYVDGTPIAEIEDGQDAGVIDLGVVDPEPYDDDIYAFLNTLTESGWYLFFWDNGDDYTYFVQSQAIDYGGVISLNQHYWGLEESPMLEYVRGVTIEDGEVVDEETTIYLTFDAANNTFATKTHQHYRTDSKAVSVWDYCDGSQITMRNGSPILYTDILNSRQYIIETWQSIRQPTYNYQKVTDLIDSGVFYQRSGAYQGGSTTWEDWEEFSSGSGGGGITDVTIDGTSIVTGGVAELETVTQLRDGIMTATDKQKLDGIESGAEANVQSDWNAVSGDAQILNKPSIPTKTSDILNDSGFVTSPNVVYCTCDTAAGTAAKTATIVSGTLATLNAGDQAIVKFVNTNTASNPTLNIAGTGAKAIKRYGTTAVGTTNATSWTAGTTFICVYDGTNWALVSWINTAYSEISVANITNGTSSTTGLISGRRAKAAVEEFAPVQSVNGQTGDVVVTGDVTDVEVDGSSVVSGGVARINLSGKADASHTHVKADITDFPSIPPTPADYITSQGVSTINSIPWRYRKWNSGMVEAWALLELATATATAWGNVYYHDDDITMPNDIFTSAPIITCTAAGNTSKPQWWIGGTSSITATSFNLRRMKVNANTQVGNVHVYAVQYPTS